MSTIYLQFLSSPGNYIEGTTPFGPRASIAIPMFSEDKDGNTIISSECVSFDDVRGQLDILRNDLNMIEKEAKRFFENDTKKKKERYGKP
jgi:hypothetical protein